MNLSLGSLGPPPLNFIQALQPLIDRSNVIIVIAAGNQGKNLVGGSTSIAAGYVSGIAARHWVANPHLSSIELTQHLCKELRLAAAEILNAAAEQWPQNPAWLADGD